MPLRIVRLVVIVLFWISSPLVAQRPIVGFGLGGGVILGTQLLDYGATLRIDGGEVLLSREINLDHSGVFDAHIELYPFSRIAIRGHGMWGNGSLRIQPSGVTDPTVLAGNGRVRISGLDGGISFWLWAPHSVGFAPFVTLGGGRVTYDFDANDDGLYFQAKGRRSESAFTFGIGADLNIWRSITLRIEAMSHRFPSPLRSEDFAQGMVPLDAFDRQISNVSLVVDAHLYLPFRGRSGVAE